MKELEKVPMELKEFAARLGYYMRPCLKKKKKKLELEKVPKELKRSAAL